MALKQCLDPDCYQLSDQTRCPKHRRLRNQERDARRGNTTARAYGAEHQQRRAQLLPAAYGQPCARCLKPMLLGQDLDLDHTDPEAKRLGLPGDRITHSACNRGGRTPTPDF